VHLNRSVGNKVCDSIGIDACSPQPPRKRRLFRIELNYVIFSQVVDLMFQYVVLSHLGVISIGSGFHFLTPTIRGATKICL
jgi:hypothetical protein